MNHFCPTMPWNLDTLAYAIYCIAVIWKLQRPRSREAEIYLAHALRMSAFKVSSGRTTPCATRDPRSDHVWHGSPQPPTKKAKA
jgi:hypothetical protein